MTRKMNQSLIVWSRHDRLVRIGMRCAVCNGMARLYHPDAEDDDCQHCGGLGWFGIDPKMPVTAAQGSIEKIAMLGVRYASGIPLWNPGDTPGVPLSAGSGPGQSLAAELAALLHADDDDTTDAEAAPMTLAS